MSIKKIFLFFFFVIALILIYFLLIREPITVDVSEIEEIFGINIPIGSVVKEYKGSTDDKSLYAKIILPAQDIKVLIGSINQDYNAQTPDNYDSINEIVDWWDVKKEDIKYKYIRFRNSLANDNEPMRTAKDTILICKGIDNKVLLYLSSW